MSQPDDRGRAEYERMTEMLFPTWEEKIQWTLDTRDAGRAGVRYKQKIIGINMELLCERPDHEIQLILVHEICHARLPETETAHGGAWRREMEEASLKAEQLGMNELTSALRSDLEFHDDAPLSEAEYHNLIRNHVAENPHHSFEETIRGVKRNHLLDEDYERKFGSSARIYDKARSISQQQHVEHESDHVMVERTVAAEYLGLRIIDLMKRHRHGKGPRHRVVDGDIRFRVEDLNAYARANGLETYPEKLP